MPINLMDPLGTSPKQSPKRRSLFRKTLRGVGWLASGPLDWVGTSRIKRGAFFIGDLVRLLRSGPDRDRRFKTKADGLFDLRASAFSYGVSLEAMEHRLTMRQRQTARISYVTAGMACFFLVAWLWSALSSPLTTARLTSALEFLPFCALFFLIAFNNALLNFQIRTGRSASWREYLSTNQPFLPR